MAKTTIKQSAKKTETENVVPAVVEKSTKPAKEPKAEKKASKKSAAVAAPAPVVEVTVEVPVVDGAAAIDANVNAEFTSFSAKLQSLSQTIANLKSEFRNLEKKAARELKAAQKASSKRRRKSGNRAPSGFVKPTAISDELAQFLGKEPGTLMARTEVTSQITEYVRQNNLQDKTNGRKLNPDAKLAKLLKMEKTDELTYFNLQKYLKPHFKSAVPA